MSNTVFSFLEEAASRWGEQTAIIDAKGAVSFSALLESSVRLSEKLEHSADLRGKGVAFVCGNGSGFVTGIFACSKTGAVPMPVLPGTKTKELESLLNESSIAVVLAQKGNAFHFSSPHNLIELDEEFNLYVLSGISDVTVDSVFPGAAFIRPSSGTTGKSKGVVISHTAVAERTEAANAGLQLNESHSMLWVMPMAFHFVVSILLYIRYGVQLIVADDFTAESIIRLANKHKATHLYASPLHYRLLVSTEKKETFRTLVNAISTSAMLESSVCNEFLKRFGFPVHQAYGIIEIGLPLINTDGSASRMGSVGKALPAYQVAILDETGNSLPPGRNGSFAIRGPGMFAGYLWPYRKAEEVLKDSWFLTGDIAEMDEDGYVFIKGREKSMINVSGNKVFPEEVEAIVKQHAGIEDARVYGGKHPLTGEIVEAEVVLKTDGKVNAEEIISFCREYLPSYKIPQRIRFVRQLSKTLTGKISRA